MASSKQILDVVALKRAGLNFNSIAEAQKNLGQITTFLGTQIQTLAYATQGDNGGATYVKVATEPSHAGKFQDVKGGWWELKAAPVTVEMFGAKGDGVTDDSAAFINAFDYIPNEGSVKLFGGKTYAATNITTPNKRFTLFSEGTAVIKAINGGDNSYLFAPLRWVNNVAFSSSPIEVINIIFDGSDIKDYCFILYNFNSIFNMCQFIQGNVAGFYSTDITKNGTTTQLQNSDAKFFQCTFENNNGDGMLNTIWPRDYSIINCKFRVNGGYGMNLPSVVGAQIIGCQSYGNITGSARLGSYGFGTMISENSFDGIVEITTIASWPTSIASIFGPHNTIKDDALILSLTGPTSVTFRVLDCKFLGENSKIVHNYNGSSRTVILDGGTSETSQPIKWTTNNSIGRVIAINHWNNYVNGFLNGLLDRRPESLASSHAPNIISVDKNLQSNTSTPITLTLTIPSSNAAGSSINMKINAFSLQNSGNTSVAYTCDVYALYVRKDASDVPEFIAEIKNEVKTANSGMSGNVAWTTSATTGDHVATLTFTLTHPVPTAVTSTLIKADVNATHKRSTLMTVA